MPKTLTLDDADSMVSAPADIQTQPKTLSLEDADGLVSSPRFDTSKIQPSSGVFQPSQFSSGLQYLVPNSENPDYAFTKAITDPQTGIIPASQKPFIPIPKFTINKDDNKFVAAGKEAVNLLAGIPEFLESPAGIATLPIAAEAKGGKILAGLFGADALKNAGQQIIQSHQDWADYTPAQKYAAVTDIAGTIGLGAFLGHTALKGTKAPIETPAAPITQPITTPEPVSTTEPVQTAPEATTPPSEPQAQITPLPNAGAYEGLSPELKAKSDAVKNSMAAEYAKLKTMPQPDWQVVVQKPLTEGDNGFVQIIDPKATEQSKSPTVESLRALGHDVPNFSQLPAGKYTYPEAVKLASESSPETAKATPPVSNENQPTDAAIDLPKTVTSAPEMVGMGAATPQELARGQGSPTAMKYKLIDQERQQRGLEPLTKSKSVSDQATMDKAMAEIDKDPSLPDKLINELNAKPRAIEDWENHVLLLRKIDLRDAFEKSAREAAQAYEDTKEFPDRAADMISANIRTADLSDKLTELEKASRVSGSARGRALRSLQVMANEDYSLASLETQRRAAKGGVPLTDKERSDLVKIADDYKKANTELQRHLDEANARNSTREVNRTIDEMNGTKKPIEPQIKSIADRIISALDKQASSALDRIKARRAEGRLFTGIDPTELADYAVYGASKFAKGLVKFSDWSAEMVKDLGDYVKPHLKQIFDAANKQLDKTIEKAVSPQNKEKVKRAVKTMNKADLKARATSNIASKIASGKREEITSQVQKLARLFVQEGIHERDALIDSVHNVLKGIDPSITRRDTMDAISGYGDFKPISKDEVSVRLRGMKGEMQQISKLEDMAKGVPPSKTGVERRTPTEAERKLIKAVNDAKVKFQVPITDPLTQLKSALDTRKIQLQNQIADMEEKISSKDFSKAPKRELVLDRKAQELQAQKERVAKKFKREQLDYQRANLPKTSKVFDFISNLRRFAVLSGVNVIGKLAAYSATKLPTMAATEAIGGALSKIPKVSKIASKAPSEGGFQIKALSKAVAKGLTQGFVDAAKTATKGQSDLRAAFSNRIESGHEWYNFFQTIHEIVKSPLRRAAFELSLAKRMEFASKHGADITDPLTQLALSKDAYLDSDRALLLENNKLASGIRGLLKQLESKDKATGKVPLHGKIAATVGRVELPILSVPLNYVKQTLTSAFGLVSGSVKLRSAFANGIENLKPEEADVILRHMKYGTIGGAMLLYGFYDGYKNGANGTFGGFYQPGEKRKDNQAGVGGLRIGGQNIPGLLLHNPVLAVGQLGHTIGSIMASKLNKKTDQTHSIPVATAAGLMGLLNQSPLGNTVELASQISDPRSAEWAMGEHIKGLVVPQLVQEVANATDKDAKGKLIKRNPTTIGQHIETGIPVLRKTVSVKKK